MQKRQIPVGLMGMNQDVRLQNKQAYSIKNLRINATSDGKALELTSERGTRRVSIGGSHAFENIIGRAVVGDFIVLFVKDTGEDGDKIYRLKPSQTQGCDFDCELLFEGSIGFNVESPIETIVSVENENVQKVYWIDGINQTRVINVAGDANPIYAKYDAIGGDPFSFCQEVDSVPEISVSKNHTGGLFHAGVVQYAVSYWNKNAQETPVVAVTSLNYVTHPDSGEEPNKQVGCSFGITINTETNRFEYMRVYQIYRTSLDTTPQVKVIRDIKIVDGITGYQLVDTNEQGWDFDAYRLLIPQTPIVAYTFAHKDQKLFEGNYEYTSSQVPERIDDIGVEWKSDSGRYVNTASGYESVLFPWENQNELQSGDIRTFKRGEWYHLGVQLQDKYGNWSDVIYIGCAYNDKCPELVFSGGNAYYRLPYCKSVDNVSAIIGQINLDDIDDFVAIRPVVSFPTSSERNVVCQGILNPTVFNLQQRIDNTCFAQASWFFRPYPPKNDNMDGSTHDDGVGYDKAAYVQFKHYSPIWSSDKICGEIQSQFFDDNTNQYQPGVVVDDETPDANGLTAFDRQFIEVDLNTQIVAVTDTEEVVFPMQEDPVVNDVTYYYANGFKQSVIDYFNSTYTNLSGGQWYYKCTAPSRKPYREVTVSENYVIYYGRYISGNTALSEEVEYIVSKDTMVPSRQREADAIRPNYAAYQIPGTDIQKYSSFYYVDQSICTLNSPEIEFGNVGVRDLSGYRTRIIGYVKFRANAGMYNIIASNPLFLNNELVGSYYTRGDELAYGFYNNPSQNTFTYGQGGVTVSALNCWFDDVCNIFSSIDGKVSQDYNPRDEQRSYYVYPWNRQYLNNYVNNRKVYESYSEYQNSDPIYITEETETSKIQSKILSNIKYGYTEYLDEEEISTIDAKLFDSTETQPIKFNDGKIYCGNIDQVVSCTSKFVGKGAVLNVGDSTIPIFSKTEKRGYPFVIDWRHYVTGDPVLQDWESDDLSLITGSQHPHAMNDHAALGINTYADNTPNDSCTDPILIKYKSTPHVVIELNGMLPISNQHGQLHRFCDQNGDPILIPNGLPWDSNIAAINAQDELGTGSAYNTASYLWIGEMYKYGEDESGMNAYCDDGNIKSRTWVPCGKSYDIDSTEHMQWTEGDTFIQRYDCLKTYPFSKDDYQSVVEIASFMVETHINLDGRYDRNRGLVDNTYITNENFNLLNPVYSQTNNFFNYKTSDEENSVNRFPNTIIWSLDKQNGAEIDEWTRINTSSSMDLDGDKGELAKLTRWRNDIFAIQEHAVSRIRYNENVALATDKGVPVELANSNLVNGKQYLNELYGTQNKWTVAVGNDGVYFYDGDTPGIYRIGADQYGNVNVTDITKNVLHGWVQKNPIARSSYDSNMNEMLFEHSAGTLAYQDGIFTSFYEYTGDIFDYRSHTVNIHMFRPQVDPDEPSVQLYILREGDSFNKFYDNTETSKYNIEFVVNSQLENGLAPDCIYDNVEYKADVFKYDNQENLDYIEPTTNTDTPFRTTSDGTTWYETFNSISCVDSYQHSSSSDGFIKKFRTWRVPVPRQDRGRMRDSWIRIKLENENPSEYKFVLRDIFVDAFY